MAEVAADNRARRAAYRCGLRAERSKLRAGTVDNLGGFRLMKGDQVIAGERYTLSAAEVIEFCAKIPSPRP